MEELDKILSEVEQEKTSKAVQALDDIVNKAEKTEKENKKVQEFLINKDEEETRMTLDFARALLAIDLEIKDLKEDQKAIKDEAKDNGVTVAKVTKALNDLKRLAKAKESDLAELEEIEKVLESDMDIKVQIEQLVKK